MAFEKDLEFRGVSITVKGSYQPFEPKTLEEPGCAEETVADEVFVGDVEITELISEEIMAEIQTEVENSE